MDNSDSAYIFQLIFAWSSIWYMRRYSARSPIIGWIGWLPTPTRVRHYWCRTFASAFANNWCLLLKFNYMIIYNIRAEICSSQNFKLTKFCIRASLINDAKQTTSDRSMFGTRVGKWGNQLPSNHAELSQVIRRACGTRHTDRSVYRERTTDTTNLPTEITATYQNMGSLLAQHHSPWTEERKSDIGSTLPGGNRMWISEDPLQDELHTVTILEKTSDARTM